MVELVEVVWSFSIVGGGRITITLSTKIAARLSKIFGAVCNAYKGL